jgi:hypothetical protein
MSKGDKVTSDPYPKNQANGRVALPLAVAPANRDGRKHSTMLFGVDDFEDDVAAARTFHARQGGEVVIVET